MLEVWDRLDKQVLTEITIQKVLRHFILLEVEPMRYRTFAQVLWALLE